MLLTDQPSAPKYFPHSVAANRKKGIITFREAVESFSKFVEGENSIAIIDYRSTVAFKEGHVKGSLNIPDDNKFETWVGSLVSPDESFCLLGNDKTTLSKLSERIVKIGYESNFKGWLSLSNQPLAKSSSLDISDFIAKRNQYAIIDVRNYGEVRDGKIFEEGIHIPLSELRDRLNEISSSRPVVTHCGGGARGAIAASILEKNNFKVYDLGPATKQFIKPQTAH